MSSQQDLVFTGLCKFCITRMFTHDIGKCKLCGSGTPSGGFSLCRCCAVEKNLCMACGNPPEKMAQMIAEKRMSLSHIPYILKLKVRSMDAQNKSRLEIRSERFNMTDNLASSIRQEFPDVKITQMLSAICTLFIEIPSKDELELVEKLKTKYDCELAEGYTTFFN